MDKNELKVHALLERISSLTSEYENKDADRRVEITYLTKQVSDLQARLNSLTEKDVEVVQEDADNSVEG